MTFTRQTQILNLMIQVSSTVQPISGVPVLLTTCETIFGPDGTQIGHPQQVQRFAIHSDMTPEVLQTLNDSLAYVGYELAPIGTK